MPAPGELTLEALVEPCAIISASTSCLEVDRAFRTVWACPSVLVRDERGRLGLVARRRVFTTMAGRRGYGRSSWGRRPVAGLASWDVPVVRPTTTVASAAALLAGEVGDFPDLPVVAADGRPLGIVRPIALMQAMADHGPAATATDDLTGTCSRAGFVSGLTALVGGLAARPGAIGVAYVDLDRLRAVNDLFGHSVGDALLRSVAQRLRRSARTDDLVGRLGGDEFGIARRLDAAPGSATAALLALGEQVRAAVAEHDDRLPMLARSTVSIGLTLTTSAGTRPESLLQTAEEATYEATLAGGDQVRLGGSTAEDRQTVPTDDLVVVYQPVVDVPTGQVTAVEALLRVRRADGRLEFPVERMATAARTGGTLALDRWVLATACSHVARWAATMGGQAPRVHVNLAPETIRSAHLAAQLLATVDGTGIRRNQVCLELSERAGVDDLARAAGQLRALAAAGLTFALDDMGATLGALRLLGTGLPVSCVKVDRSVVVGAGLGLAVDLEMLGLVRRLGERFGVEVVAEGVESTAEDDAVRSSGIDRIQGYRYGQPLLEPDLMRVLLAQRPGADTVLPTQHTRTQDLPLTPMPGL